MAKAEGKIHVSVMHMTSMLRFLKKTSISSVLLLREQTFDRTLLESGKFGLVSY